MTDPSLDPIFAYLREHSGRYSYSALRDQLLENGYAPAEVDRALAIYQQEHPPTVPSSVWSKAKWILLFNALLTGAAIVAMFDDWHLEIFSLIFIGEFLAGLVLSFRKESRPLGQELLSGCLFSIALGILILGGLCVYGQVHNG